MLRTALVLLLPAAFSGCLAPRTTPPAATLSADHAVAQLLSRSLQDAGLQRFLADNVSIDNLTVCNYLTDSGGGKGNEIWWNGGDGTGALNMPSIGLRGYEGSYLTATSSYSSSTTGSFGPCCGTGFPAGNYGIFSSNAKGPGSYIHAYASNMGDAGFYVGACPDCNAVLNDVHTQYSALGFSGTNAGGHLILH